MQYELLYTRSLTVHCHNMYPPVLLPNVQEMVNLLLTGHAVSNAMLVQQPARLLNIIHRTCHQMIS